MSVDTFGRTGKRYDGPAAEVHAIGNFLPLAGGSLTGSLAMGPSNLEFSTGDILSQEDLSFVINRDAKLVI